MRFHARKTTCVELRHSLKFVTVKNGTLKQRILIMGIVAFFVAVIMTEKSNALPHPVENASAPDVPALVSDLYAGSSSGYASEIVNAKEFNDCFGRQILD